MVSKVLLGTLACTPVCDEYFSEGFKAAGHPRPSLNERFLNEVFVFCASNEAALRSEQKRIHTASGIVYPFMKLVDMYFWQLAYSAREPT